MAVRRTEALDERALFAAYPFLPGAERLVGGSGSLQDLLLDPSFAGVRELGRVRIRSALDDPTGSRELREMASATPEERYLSFFFAQLVLAASPTPAALRRWAVAEAKRHSARTPNSLPELVEVARRLDLTFEPSPEGIHVPLAVYLELSVPIREADFRLARQRLAHGQVLLTLDRAARILQEGIRAWLARPVPIDSAVRDALSNSETEFLAEVARRLPAPVARIGTGAGGPHPEIFPPCIRKMRRSLEAGENLSHSGRFALAAFLHRTGADFETIVDAYRGAPDFDEGITRYQVEHITRHDRGAGYTPPDCDTLRTHGLCFREGDPTAKNLVDREKDPRCFEPTLRHPLTYYRRRGGRVVESESSSRPLASSATR